MRAALVLGLLFAAPALAQEGQTPAPAPATPPSSPAVQPKADKAVPPLKVGALVIDKSGETIGRLNALIPAVQGEPPKAELAIGNRVVTAPQSELTSDGTFVFVSRTWRELLNL